jgi:hypothetical protein
MHRFRRTLPRALAVALLILVAAGAALAKGAKPAATPAAKPAAKAAGAPAMAMPPGPAWVQKSNAYAMPVLTTLAKFSPEGASRYGVPGLDREITDLTPGYNDRARAASNTMLATLERNLAAEADPPVKQDLAIMIATIRQHGEGDSLQRALMLPYFDVAGTIFQGVKTLLDDQIAADRRPAAVTRLRKYAGLEPGFTPLATLATDRTKEKLGDAALVGPSKDEVENDLRNGATYLGGIEELCKKYQLSGWEEPLAAIKKQLADYETFVRASVLPRARTDFRQPPAIYAQGLKQYGVDMAVPELVSRAEVSFKEIQNQMDALAPLVAKEKGLTVTDYRGVIHELKKKQLVGDAIMPHYQARIREIEDIIRREKIVTLPNRDMAIRFANDAETAAIPAPHMDPPRMIGNTGEKGTFVLPRHVPSANGNLDFDDFSHEAESWTLTAHEGRPGHELQFSSITERGVSIARALFAFNSVNAEGWGLYAEAEMQPYEPLDGQLFTLQSRLMRAARAFLDPGVQAGTVTKDEAMRVLTEDVGLSKAMATQEVERYTFRAPGQATSYFVGYNRILEVREEAERALGPRFDRQQFNDFVLSQGLLPPNLLRAAVVAEFIPQHSGGAAAAAAKPASSQ